MLLGARFLDNFVNVNTYVQVDYSLYFFEGEGPTITLQLLDVSKDRAEQGFNHPGRRYMPSAGALLQVTLDNLDDSKKLVKAAVQPLPTQDPSIWQFAIMPTDPVRGTVNLLLTLTEPGGLIRKCIIENALRVNTDSSLPG